VIDFGREGRSEGGRIMGGVREEAHKLIDALPEETSWDDVIYQMYVRKKIARGLEASEQGHVVAHDEVKKLFLSQ
jgi:predicted transcriptional regulator